MRVFDYNNDFVFYHLKKYSMLKTKFELAKEVVDQYNHEFLQGDTMLHIQEWIDEQAETEKKQSHIIIDENWLVIDVDKSHFVICDCCGSTIKYQKVSFSKSFVPTLQKILDYVVDLQKNTWQHKNIIEIADLNLTHTEYWNLNRLANFGLLYRQTDAQGNRIKDWSYWVPQKRIFDFLNGDWQVARFYVVKSTTHERTLSKERISIDQLPQVDGWTEYKTKQMPWYVSYILNDNIA